MKVRTTIYLDDKLKSKYDLYKSQCGGSLSECLNMLLEKHLNNPFNWQEETLYSLSKNIVGEVQDNE